MPKEFKGAELSSSGWSLVIAGVLANGASPIACSTLAIAFWMIFLAEVYHKPFFFWQNGWCMKAL